MALHLYRPGRSDRPIQGVLFDMDGLVLDTETLYSRFWREGAQALGFPMTFQQSLQLRSLNNEAGQAKLTEFFGPAADYEAIRRKRIEKMDAFIRTHGVQSKPGIFALLDALNRWGIPCAITSSSPQERIAAYLTPLGLYDRFDKICSGYDVPHGKPAPDIYLLGASALGVPPESCLALEDSPAGILSAHRAGCLPVMIPDLDQPDPETQALLYAKADSLEDVIGLLDG